MTEAPKADEASHVPAALALRQRPGIPGIRSTFGSGTELLSSLSITFSRLASHRCPNGHYVPPSLTFAACKLLELSCLRRGISMCLCRGLGLDTQGACRTCAAAPGL
ncbi:MAG: hypothetical protein V8T46_11515 [Sutterella seckii]